MQFGLENQVVLKMGRNLVLVNDFLVVADLSVQGHFFFGGGAFRLTGGGLGGPGNTVSI